MDRTRAGPTRTMLAGAALGTAFSFGKLMMVIAGSSAILGAYVSMMGFVGARTG
ncbi:hypothetical protein [Rhodococcus jostii]|uniref:hypothetical protein n=1 Tax=Rhodococcus jostii TaxID=132919 RepID=UPI001F0879D2|nr:hypothetical protein [Rhodococcus jostii]